MKIVQDVIEYTKQYKGYKEFKAIMILLVAIYQAVMKKTED